MLTIEPKRQVGVLFILNKRATAHKKREVITVDVTINDRRIGGYAEGFIDI